jgi:hypothetical protein
MNRHPDRKSRTPRFRAYWLSAAVALVPSLAHADFGPRTVTVLTDNNFLLQGVESRVPVFEVFDVLGLRPGDTLKAIDVRPMNGRLYGIATNASGGVQLYHLTIGPPRGLATRALATPVGSTGSFANAAGNPVAITAVSLGMDFISTTDSIRVVSSAGDNFRINPNNGAFIDGNLGGAVGSVAGINQDAPISGATTNLHAIAYTNSRINATTSTLYGIDATSNAILVGGGSLNNGSYSNPIPITVNGLPLDINADVGLDFGSDTSPGYMINTVANQSIAYRINPLTGAAVVWLTFSVPIIDIAVSVEPPGIMLSATSNQIGRFLLTKPELAVRPNLSGIIAGETVAGIDGRPSTGNVYALGIDAIQNNGTLYRVEPQTGLTVRIGSIGGIAFVNAAGAAVDFPNNAKYGVDFDPLLDQIRVVNSSGLNFRINPDTGAPLDGDLGGAAASVAGINPDGALNGLTTNVSGLAYTNNETETNNQDITTLYSIGSSGNRLLIQNPPRSGTQTNGIALTLNGAAFGFDSQVGFDIPPGVNAPALNQPATGFGYVTLSGASSDGLYRINLATGALDFRGNLPFPADGLIAWRPELDGVFRDDFE